MFKRLGGATAATATTLLFLAACSATPSVEETVDAGVASPTIEVSPDAGGETPASSASSTGDAASEASLPTCADVQSWFGATIAPYTFIDNMSSDAKGELTCYVARDGEAVLPAQYVKLLSPVAENFENYKALCTDGVKLVPSSVIDAQGGCVSGFINPDGSGQLRGGYGKVMGMVDVTFVSGIEPNVVPGMTGDGLVQTLETLVTRAQ